MKKKDTEHHQAMDDQKKHKCWGCAAGLCLWFLFSTGYSNADRSSVVEDLIC